MALAIGVLLSLIVLAPGADSAVGSPLGDPVAADDGSPVSFEPAEEAQAPANTHPTRRYFVVLDDPPLAQYRGGIPGLAPTAVGYAVVDSESTEGESDSMAGHRGVHLDTTTPAAQAYISHLERVQESYIQQVRAIAPEFADPDWQYQTVLNGFVAELTPRHAMNVSELPGVLVVYPEEELTPEMDSTAQLINTLDAWEAAGGPEEAGLGARVAVLEAGSAVVHPFFRDEGMPDSPEGYPSAQVYGADGTVMELLEPERLVNGKIIGARVIVEEVVTTSLGSYTTSASNHGRHVSGTIAGRYGTYDMADLGAPGVELSMGGVAPMAWLFHYYNMDGTPGMVKAFEIMVEDQIDAVNLSLGSSGWLLDGVETHPIRLAQTAAAEAGVLTVGSAGNAGANGRTSLSGAWKYSEDIMVVGNSTTTGAFVSEVVVEGEDVPEELQMLWASPPRGTIAITEPITAPLILADEGGCVPDPKYADKIAIAERFGPGGSSDVIGPCGYTDRAEAMEESGAVAIIYIYYNQYIGAASSSALALPAVAMGVRDGKPLVDFLRDGGEAIGTLVGDVERSYEDYPDLLSSSSSRGPGLDWSIKPDITAPGTGIISSVLIDDDPRDEEPPRGGFASYSGTSMSAPHITGSAGLLRYMHPDWTVPQLRSALINTSKRVLQVGDLVAGDLEPARPTDGGPGRVDLAYAHDPRALLDPPKVAFGSLPTGITQTMEVAVESACERTMLWKATLEPLSGDAKVSVEPMQFRLKPDSSITLTVTMDTTDVAEDEHWGDIHLNGVEMKSIFLPMVMKDYALDPDQMAAEPFQSSPAQEADGPDDTHDGSRHLRLVYYAHVDVPELRRDVLIVNWTYGETEDYTSYYTSTLEELGMTYTVWSMGEEEDGHEDRQTSHPPYKLMTQHDLVILNANMSQVSMMEELRGQFHYQNYMLGGGNFLIAGQGTQDWWRYLGGSPLSDTPANRSRYSHTWPYRWYSYSQNVGCEMCLARYFAGFTPGITATLSGRLLYPYPVRPDMPEMEVVLEPHADADPTVFDYALDISTGALGKDGAAGNQYMFASGEVMKDFVPSLSATDTTKLGDISYGEGVPERIGQYAMPLWTYPVSDTQKVVGTYIAGKHSTERDVVWNAMFWGFGLEGVGEGAEGTVSRARLLGDTYNFMARNIRASSVVTPSGSTGIELEVSFAKTADLPALVGAEVSWGDDDETITFDEPVTSGPLMFMHEYDASGDYSVSIVLLAMEGESAAPIYLEEEISIPAP